MHFIRAIVQHNEPETKFTLPAAMLLDARNTLFTETTSSTSSKKYQARIQSVYISLSRTTLSYDGKSHFPYFVKLIQVLVSSNVWLQTTPFEMRAL